MMKESKHVTKFKSDHLQSGESVLAWSKGYIGEAMGRGDKTQHNGVLIVTESRAVFYRKGFTGEIIETMPLKSISSIERKSTFGFHTITMHASHDDLSFKSTDGKEATQALVDTIERGRADAPSPSQPAAEPEQNQPDAIEQIKKLAELKDAGALTDEEFQAKKEKLLAEI
ncbi:hypothetical protein BZG06_10155 [Salinivibrio kushneri]|uniref:YokE-like PH domain-containing protein n=1 Tax=Salinivibrio kushneri TaxID=1908198 RepID=A0AB36K8J7_9GAMM|nr:SHOCT domain-containing protein [Salinivibrio kushneri]OOE43993.1 hypothetical protein BZG06_10155 [Salinivibrio kushneri]OOE45138.1 hypothetical protein BZG09_05395 [Salinivibrio kushneri]